MDSACSRRFRGSQLGQSLTEAAVLCAVLVPLFLLVPILAKYIHARQAAQQAARAVAWEATVAPNYRLPSAMHLRDLAVERNFGRADAKITSTVKAGARDTAVGDTLMNTFSNRPLLRQGDVELTKYRSDKPSGIMSKLGGITSKFSSFPPNKQGLTTASLQINMQDIKLADGGAASFLEPFDALGLKIQATHVVLADPWNAAGSGLRVDSPRSVLAQVKHLVPSTHLSAITKVFDGLSSIPMLGTLDKLELGYIAPDVVPMDKLQNDAPAR